MIDALRTDGIVALGKVLTDQQCDDIAAYLADKPMCDGHIERKHGREDYQPGTSIASSYSTRDVLRTPHLLDAGLAFTDLAQTYLATDPIYCYSVNIFNTYPSHAPLSGDIQEYHRDRDDHKFLALFVYLTDVLNEADGGHQYLAGTHSREHDIRDGDVITILGPRGSAFIADGWGYHRGLRPVTMTRTIAWVRWGVSLAPRTYTLDGIEPVDMDGFEDYAELLKPIVRSRVQA